MWCGTERRLCRGQRQELEDLTLQAALTSNPQLPGLSVLYQLMFLFFPNYISSSMCVYEQGQLPGLVTSTTGVQLRSGSEASIFNLARPLTGPSKRCLASVTLLSSGTCSPVWPRRGEFGVLPGGLWGNSLAARGRWGAGCPAVPGAPTCL